MRKTMAPNSATLHVDSQLRKAGNPLANLYYEWNVSLLSYASIWMLNKISEQYCKSRFENVFLKMDVYKLIVLQSW